MDKGSIIHEPLVPRTFRLLAELEKDSEAIQSFEKAVSLNPYDFESYASLGQIYYSKAETTFLDADAVSVFRTRNPCFCLCHN